MIHIIYGNTGRSTCIKEHQLNTPQLHDSGYFWKRKGKEGMKRTWGN